MGCKGSKHDVATDNTIKPNSFHRKSSAKSKTHYTAFVTKTRDVTSLENFETGKNRDEGLESEKEVKSPTQVKNVIIDAEEKDGGLEEYEEVFDGHGRTKTASMESLDHYYSPRKDEEAVVGGETSEYGSPTSSNVDHGKRGERPLNVIELKEGERIDIKEEKTLVAETAMECRVGDEKMKHRVSTESKEPTLVEENRANHVEEIIEKIQREDLMGKGVNVD